MLYHIYFVAFFQRERGLPSPIGGRVGDEGDLLIQPAPDFAAILAEHGRLFITLVKPEWTARFKATSCWQIDQTRRLACDEHRV